MKIGDINELLETVRSELISNYEKNCLDGKTLQSVVDEYNRVKKDSSKTFILWMVVIVGFFILALITGALAAVHTKQFNQYLVAGFFLSMIPIATFVKFGSKKMDKQREVISRCREILESFEKAIAKLNPLGITVPYYSKESVHEILVRLAVQKLEAETSVEYHRKLNWLDVHGLQCSCNFYLSRAENLEQALICAQNKFGLEFVKRKLYTEAVKRVGSLEERIAKEKLKH